MAHITTAEVQAWLEATKLTVNDIDVELETSVSSVVLATLASAYDITGWSDTSATPSIVKTVIAMKYTAWYYRRAYSEDDGNQPYADKLDAWADSIIAGIVSGAIDVVEVSGTVTISEPSYFPTDTSTDEFGNLAPAKFTMGMLL